MKDKLTIKKLQDLLQSDKLDRTAMGYDSVPYFHFLQYFESLEEVQAHHFYIATGFAYSWMPTMLKKVSCSIEVLSILNKVKKGGFAQESELRTLAEAINNSLVGVSKLLHFVAPNRYAIWDSRVYRSIFNKIYDSSLKSTFNDFIEYINCANELILLPEYNPIHQAVLEHLSHDDLSKVTKLRTLELLLYAYSDKLYVK